MPLESEVVDTIPESSQPAGGELSPEQFAGGGDIPASSGVPDQAGGEHPPVQAQGVRDLLGSLGYQLPEGFQGGDFDTLVHLAQQARRAQQLEAQQREADVYRDLGRQLAPHAQKIQQAFQQPEPSARKPYQPPPFNRDWARLVTIDEGTGRYVKVHRDVPDSIVDAANERAEWQSRFLDNPTAMFESYHADQMGGIEQKVNQLVEERFRQVQAQEATYRIAQQNADWAYARDDRGNWLTDPLNGGLKLTPLGQQYLGLLQRGRQLGLTDPAALNEWATTALRPEIYAATRPAQDRNAETAARRQQQAIASSRTRQNPIQSLARQQRSQTIAGTEPDTSTISLRDLLRERMAEEGIADAQIDFGT